MTRRRAGMAAAAAVGTLSMVGGGLAWACTASPSIVSVDPLGEASPSAGAGFGTAGSTVSVKGSAVTPLAPVSIRWNATDGPVIGVAMASDTGKFAVAANVPATSPGVYYLLASVGGLNVARTAFEVTGAGGPAAVQGASLWATSPGSPAPAIASAAASGGSTSAGMVGVGVLGGGLVVLFAGATAATLGRRRRRAVVS